MANRRRSLPPVSPKIAAELRPLVAAISEIIETGEGVRGDPMDRKITLRDLVDGGVITISGNLRGGGGTIAPQPTPPNRSTPPPPSNFNAYGGFDGRIDLTWTIPSSLYSNHAYTNIYRAETDNFANAILVGREAGAFYTDIVRDDVTPTLYYYWITFTSKGNIEGPTNGTAGTPAQALIDVEYLLETLSNNLDDAPTTQGAANETLILHAERFAIRTGEAGAFTYPLIIADIVGVPTVVLDTAIIRDGTIQSGQIGALTFGKLVAADGFTPITTVSGLLKADYIDADNLSVASAATFYGDAQSGSFQTDVDGWKFWQTGSLEAYNVTVRGHIEADSGYIASTLQIGGTPDDLATVQSNAASAITTANAAKTKTDAWTRPGFTLIDGNKIYTGDAYVDTLQIKGQAVTFPRGISSSAVSYISAGAGYYNMISLAVASTGAPIMFTATFSGYLSGSNQSGWINLRVVRGGTIVFGPVTILNAYLSDQTTYTVDGISSLSFYLASAVSGTYTMQVSKYGGSYISYRYRALTALEAKR